MTATLDGDFVVFLIGMRINRPLKVRAWVPVVRAMRGMLVELHRHPELGFLGAQTWFRRSILVVQYWRSLDQLLAYSTNRDAQHLPAWRDFNRTIGTDGTVGSWHGTYCVPAGRYESVYLNMPPFGLGRESARGRLGTRPPVTAAPVEHETGERT